MLPRGVQHHHHRALTPALAVAVAAVAVAGGAAAGGRAVTIGAEPKVMAAPMSPSWHPLTLSGSVASGETGESVTVQANECAFPGWRDAGVVQTGRAGAWDASADVLTTTTFRARWKGSYSEGITVEARPGVEIEQVTRSRWSVGVFAVRSFLDRPGQLQRFDARARRWRTVKTFRLTEKVRRGAVGVWTYAHFRARVRRGSRVRAYVPRTSVAPCYLAGYSIILGAR